MFDALFSRRELTNAGCWEWTGCRDDCGYGVVRWHGKNRKVHRVIAHLFLGLDLDSKKQALHKCDNPPCFNPFHLFLGGYKENMNDRDNKGRQWQMSKKVCKSGHPLSGDNLSLTPSRYRLGKFVRGCKECERTYSRNYARKLRSTPEGRQKHRDAVMASYRRKKVLS